MLRILMTARREDRRQKRDIGAEPRRPRKIASAVAGDGHEPRRARAGVRRPPARRPVHAVRTDRRGEALIAREKKHEPAAAADRQIAAGERLAPRMIVVAEDDGRPRRQGAQQGLRVRDAAPVGQEGERKRRVRARRPFERPRGGC